MPESSLSDPLKNQTQPFIFVFGTIWYFLSPLFLSHLHVPYPGLPPFLQKKMQKVEEDYVMCLTNCFEGGKGNTYSYWQLLPVMKWPSYFFKIHLEKFMVMVNLWLLKLNKKHSWNGIRTDQPLDYKSPLEKTKTQHHAFGSTTFTI